MEQPLNSIESQNQQNPISNPKISSYNKKVVFSLIFIVSLLIIGGSSYIFNLGKKQKENQEKKPAIAAPSNIPEKWRLQGVTRREEVLPQNLKNKSSEKKVIFYESAGKNLVIVNAIVIDTIIPAEKYKLMLDSGEEVIVQVTNKTTLGDAWYGFKDGLDTPFVISTEFASKSALVRLEQNKKVSIEYFEEDYKKDKALSLVYLTLLE